MRRVVALAVAASAAAAVWAVAAHGGSPDPRTLTGPDALAAGATSFARGTGDVVAGEFLPGLPVAIAVPDAPAALLVLVPGGGWARSDPAGMTALGTDLASRGLAAVTITYGTADAGAYYPENLHDVTCGIAYAAQQVPDVPVVVVGHSAGAHLAALAGLDPSHPDDAGCPYPARAADAVVGLAGPYNTQASVPRALLGPHPAPGAVADSDPAHLVRERPDLPFLLVHGDADSVVPPWSSTDFRIRLERGGHLVTVRRLHGVSHGGVIAPEHVGEVIDAWVRTTFPGALPGSGDPPAVDA